MNQRQALERAEEQHVIGLDELGFIRMDYALEWYEVEDYEEVEVD